MLEKLFDSTTQVVEKSMQLRMMRQNFLASNIANAETPNYRAVDIDFQATMQNLIAEAEKVRAARKADQPMDMQRTDARHLSLDAFSNPILPRQIIFAAGDSTSIGDDSNSVSLEQQMARLQMNALHHQMMSRLLARKISGLKNVIEGSSRG
jgi:flagellar basal-body rod protein FlgB